jgi:hypothetical protein
MTRISTRRNGAVVAAALQEGERGEITKALL